MLLDDPAEWAPADARELQDLRLCSPCQAAPPQAQHFVQVTHMNPVLSAGPCSMDFLPNHLIGPTHRRRAVGGMLGVGLDRPAVG